MSYGLATVLIQHGLHQETIRCPNQPEIPARQVQCAQQKAARVTGELTRKHVLPVLGEPRRCAWAYHSSTHHPTSSPCCTRSPPSFPAVFSIHGVHRRFEIGSCRTPPVPDFSRQGPSFRLLGVSSYADLRVCIASPQFDEVLPIIFGALISDRLMTGSCEAKRGMYGACSYSTRLDKYLVMTPAWCTLCEMD